MTKTCEDYGNTHNLTFITDPMLKKCKTKCLAFLTKKRNLKNIKLKGSLPWVDAAKHLGCRIWHKNHGVALDLMEKRLNVLNQEFHYAHPLTKVKINNIFNTHFYGSQLWDLFSVEAIRLGKTFHEIHIASSLSL